MSAPSIARKTNRIRNRVDQEELPDWSLAYLHEVLELLYSPAPERIETFSDYLARPDGLPEDIPTQLRYLREHWGLTIIENDAKGLAQRVRRETSNGASLTGLRQTIINYEQGILDVETKPVRVYNEWLEERAQNAREQVNKILGLLVTLQDQYPHMTNPHKRGISRIVRELDKATEYHGTLANLDGTNPSANTVEIAMEIRRTADQRVSTISQNALAVRILRRKTRAHSLVTYISRFETGEYDLRTATRGNPRKYRDWVAKHLPDLKV